MQNLLKILGMVIVTLTLGCFAFAQDTDTVNPELSEEKALSDESLSAVAEKQDAATSAQETASKTEPPKAEEDIEWAWGDVVSVDIEKGQFSVKYLDYETDTEEEIAFYIDEKTVFENAQNLGEIRPQDSASVDYAITNEGKNVARLISIEKNSAETPESTPTP